MAFSIISRTASRSFICCSRDIGGRLGLLRLVGFVGFDAASLLPRNHQDGNHELHRAIAAGLERLVEEVKPLIRLPKTIPCPSPDDWALEELSLCCATARPSPCC